MRNSTRSFGYLLLAHVTLAGILCGCESVKKTSQDAALANPLGPLEDGIKLKAMSEPSSLASKGSQPLVMQIELKMPGVPTAVMPQTQNCIYVLDNESGKVYVVTYSGTTAKRLTRVPLPIQLERPIMMRSRGKSLYFLDGPNLFVVDRVRGTYSTIHHMYTGYDFVVMDKSHWALNPIERSGGRAPLVVEIASQGQAVSEWGIQETASVAGLGGRAHLALCRSVMVAALTYKPIVHIFSPQRRSDISVHLPIPGESQLMTLANQNALTNPQRDVYALPRFLAGVSCSAGSIFVLADLPIPYIYELSTTGKLLAIYVGSTAHPGRHFSTLSTAIYEGHTYFYTIATDASEDPQKIIVMKGG